MPIELWMIAAAGVSLIVVGGLSIWVATRSFQLEAFTCDYCRSELDKWEYTVVGYLQLPKCPECGETQIDELGWTPQEVRELNAD